MTHPEQSSHQPLEELLEICDEVIAHSSNEDLGNVVQKCYSRLPASAHATDQRLEDLLGCLELLELDRRTQRSHKESQTSAEPGSLSTERLRIERFRIERQLGRGGFGVVYLAEDPILCRNVAIKIPRPEIIASESLRARFVRESQVVAKLSHPNIIKIHEAGQSGPVSFQVMEYCVGGSLASFLSHTQETEIDRHALPPRMAVELLLAVADGVEHAHRHGILHRDLKPANILLQPLGTDSTPISFAKGTEDRVAPEMLKQYRPVVTDFGLAKLLADASDSLQQQMGVPDNRDQTSMAGTPNYMAPEQFSGNTQPASAASDVFGLGVILFELLAGRPMFVQSGSGQPQTTESRTEVHPSSVHRTSRELSEEMPGLSRDLIAICQKATRPHVADRYQTVEQMTDDLRAFLHGEPIKARAWSLSERVLRWTVRRPAIASLAGLVSLLALGLVLFGGWHLTRLTEMNQKLTQTAAERQQQANAAMEARRRADQQTAFARIQQQLAEEQTWIAHEREYATEMIQTSQAWTARDAPRMSEHLQRIKTIPGRYSSLFELRYLSAQSGTVKSFLGHKDTIVATRLKADNEWLYSISKDATIRCWDVGTQQLLRTVDLGGDCSRHKACMDSLATLAVIRRTFEQSNQDEVIIVDLQTDQILMRRSYRMHDVCCISASSDGKLVAVGGRRQPTDGEFIPFLEIWVSDTRQGKQRAFAKEPILIETPSCHAVFECAFVGSKSDLAVATIDGVPDHWTYQLGLLSLEPLAFNPGSEPNNPIARIEAIGEVRHGRPAALQLSADGSRVAVLLDQSVNGVDVLSLPSGTCEMERRLGTAIPESMHLKADGTSIALSLSELSEADWELLNVYPTENQYPVTEALFTWDLISNPLSLTSYEPTRVIASIEPMLINGVESWILGEIGGSLRIWSPHGTSSEKILQGHSPRETWSLVYSPDGKLIFSAGDDHSVRSWSKESGLQVCQSRPRDELVSCLAISPDGKYIAAGGYDDLVTIHDAATLNTVATLAGHTHDVRAVAFSRDGRKLASGARDRQVRVWNLQNHHCTHQLTSHGNTIRAVTWLKNGDLISSDSDGVVNFWSPEGSLKSTHWEHEGVLSIAIAPAGVQIPLGDKQTVVVQRPITSLVDETPTVSNLSSVINDRKDETDQTQLTDDMTRDMNLLKVGDDELFAFGMARGSVRILHPDTGHVWSFQRQSNLEIRSISFSKDGSSLVGGCGDGSIRFWQISTQREILRLENQSAVHQIDFSPSGDSLAAAMHDGSVKVFDAKPSELTFNQRSQ